MLTQQQLILALAATFSVPGSSGYALEESTALPFALPVGKALITSPKPFIEVSSTEKVYISEGHALALADTQCLHTETPPVQLCFGNRWPTRIRLLPHGHLKIGLHALGLSLLEYIHYPSFVTEPLVPGQEALPELNPVAQAIVTKILQGIEQQGDIMEKARQRSLMFSHLNSNKNDHKSDHTLFGEPLGEVDAKEDNEPIEWWGVVPQPTSDTNDSDLVRVRFDNDILLKPDTRYCFVPGTDTRAYRQAVPGDSSGSEDNGSSDENSDSDSDSGEEDFETSTDPDVEFIGTTPDPFPVAREIREYCAGLEQKKIKQEPISDSEMPTGPKVDNTQYPGLKQASEISIGSTVTIAADSTQQQPANQEPPGTRKKRTHSRKKSHPCQECSKTFTRSSHLKIHQRTHSGEKPYPCQVCGKMFTQNGTLKRHLRTHSGEKPYTCQQCGKTFARASSLKKHQRIHSGEKPYTCQECGKAFAQSSHLNRHLRTHNGEKPYLCQKCGKRFSDSKVLTAHLRTHSGEKPYLCQDCGKAFAQCGALKIHQRTHSGEKPYPCPECGKAFSNSSHLKTHQRTHSGKKPYPCPICGKAFTQSSHLKKHQRTHTTAKNPPGKCL